nr:unnamed protein product [Naegleria fowleri]
MIEISSTSLPNLYAEPIDPFISCFGSSPPTFSVRVFVDSIATPMTINRQVAQYSNFASSTVVKNTQQGTIFNITISAYSCLKIQYAEMYTITMPNGATMNIYLTTSIVKFDIPNKVDYSSSSQKFSVYETNSWSQWDTYSQNIFNQDLQPVEIVNDDSTFPSTLIVTKRNVYYTKTPYFTGNRKFIFSHKYGGKAIATYYMNSYSGPTALTILGCNNLVSYANSALDYISNQIAALPLTSVKRITEMDTLLRIFLYCPYGSTLSDNQASLYYLRQSAMSVAGIMLTEVEKAKNVMFDMDDYLAKLLKSFTQNLLTFTSVTGVYNDVMKNGDWKTSLIGNIQLVTTSGLSIPFFNSRTSSFLVDVAMDGSNQDMKQYASNIVHAVEVLHALYESSNSSIILKGFKMFTKYLYSLKEVKSLITVLEANPVDVSINFPKSGIVDNGFYGDYRLAVSTITVSQPQNETKIANTFVIPMVVTAHFTRLEDNSILSVTNLTENIKILFDTFQPPRQDFDSYMNGDLQILCVYYDNQNWSSNGVSTFVQSSSDGSLTIVCETSHLSSFAVIYQEVSKGGPMEGLSGGAIAGIVIASLILFACLVTLIVTIVLLVGYYVIYPRVVLKKRKLLLSSNTTNSTSKEEKKVVQTITSKLSEKTGNILHSKSPSTVLSETLNSSSPFPLNIDTDSKTNYTSSLFISEYSSVRTDHAPSPSNSIITSSTIDIVSKKYEIIEKIGAGAFGAVFKARYLLYSGKAGESEFVAIKRVNLTGLSELNEKFQEAVNMFKNKHENIVTLQDAIVDQNTMSLFLAMKYYSFGDLEMKVKAKQRLSEKMLKQIIYQVCKGLNYIQVESGMIHRDVKPSNIFIDSIDEKEQTIRVVLSDFGLAKESDMMSSFSFAGTPYFMSPQLLIGSKYSFNTDIFSLGCSIFIMITFDSSQSLAQLYLRNQSNLSVVHSFIIESIEKAAPSQYSKEFVDLLLAMLEFDADKRPNAKDILDMSFFNDQ